MAPSLALVAWAVLLVGLLWFDPARESKVSAALWVPLAWMFFLGSRAPSLWLGGQVGPGYGAAEVNVEGNPLNRTISLVLFGLSIAILLSRSFRWPDFFAKNWALSAFLLFSLLSVLWSDFPFPAFRKWFRDCGNYSMVLVVLSDPRPFEALRTLLRRLGYLLIPLCIVLIKYFPTLSRLYDPWTGFQTFTGATASKNMLGIVCLVCGIYFFWDTVVRWQDRNGGKRRKQILLVNALFMGMIVWLLNLSNSATSRTCLVIACLVILMAHSKLGQRRPGLLTVTIPCVFLLYALLAFGIGLSGQFATAVGRDPTMSGRTEIWDAVLSQRANPLLGAGYESFWLGPRLERIWALGLGAINEAHNGYLEVYLNLGYVGLFLLFLFVVGVYRNICKMLKPFSVTASLALATWTVFLFHNFTEVDFRSGLMWIFFVLVALAVEVDMEGARENGRQQPARQRELLPSPLVAVHQPAPVGAGGTGVRRSFHRGRA